MVLKVFEILATVLFRCGSGKGNEKGYISYGSRIGRRRMVIAVEIAEPPGIADGRGLGAVKQEFVEFPEEDLGFSELVDGYNLDPVSINF